MTGYDIYKKTFDLLGYGDNTYSPKTAEISEKRCFESLNIILSDLKSDTVKNVSEELSVSPAVSEALIYGVAMLISLGVGDGERNRIFTELYNAKRAAALAAVDHVGDRLPSSEGE